MKDLSYSLGVKINIKKQGINKEKINGNWQKIYVELPNEIKVRHYSPNTLKSYLILGEREGTKV